MIIFLTLLLLVGLDQGSKYLAVLYLQGTDGVEVIPNFFRLYYLENRGAAFGILQDSRLFFIVITIFVILFISYLLFFKKHHVKGINRLSLILILSGTIGNFIDRLRLSYVVDFLSFRFFGWNFAVFNIADALIVIGTVLLIIAILKSEGNNEKA